MDNKKILIIALLLLLSPVDLITGWQLDDIIYIIASMIAGGGMIRDAI